MVAFQLHPQNAALLGQWVQTVSRARRGAYLAVQAISAVLGVASVPCANKPIRDSNEEATVDLKSLMHASGSFKLELYALPASDGNDSLRNAHSNQIKASSSHWLHSLVMSLPKQLEHWYSGCYLKTPADAVVLCDKWTQIDSLGDHWKGNIHMKKHWSKNRKLTIRAKYAAKDTNYNTLMEYSLAF
ncbi:unnamed protein product [Dibothriocephalus latus]|uniref:Uncharacterized protein n=1 Tax=Dibothriocephalus latus TaxID=60516 RepID=A0A3P7L6Q4_DIBLA|nr:unnamed protein product [Dibothriocephalus latus]